MPTGKVKIAGTHQRVSSAGAAWIEAQIVEFRTNQHRDPEGAEIYAIVMSWRELEAVTSIRRSARREHKKICTNEDFRWKSKAPPRR